MNKKQQMYLKERLCHVKIWITAWNGGTNNERWIYRRLCKWD